MLPEKDLDKKLMKMPVTELKSQLKNAGLSPIGKKQTLVTRLFGHMKSLLFSSNEGVALDENNQSVVEAEKLIPKNLNDLDDSFKNIVGEDETSNRKEVIESEPKNLNENQMQIDVDTDNTNTIENIVTENENENQMNVDMDSNNVNISDENKDDTEMLFDKVSKNEKESIGETLEKKEDDLTQNVNISSQEHVPISKSHKNGILNNGTTIKVSIKNKNRRRRLNRKKNKIFKINVELYKQDLELAEKKTDNDENKIPDIKIEYEAEIIEFDGHFKCFENTIDKFETVKGNKVLPIMEQVQVLEKAKISENVMPEKIEVEPVDKEENVDADCEDKKLTKRQFKRQSRMSIADLKSIADRPELVEYHDVNSPNPVFLMQLKSYPNSVPIPRHWCSKRKYLAGKMGYEKKPYSLPECIAGTGIMEMRQALQDKEDHRSLKAKMRERIRPKTGKIDIDYQKLHDAFFKFQKKPKVSRFGEIYYEGKEFETNLRDRKPGELSDELKISLGMPTGQDRYKIPPPWLIAMQRYGPPPNYKGLKIPGLNYPIPEGCSFGFLPGQWGKPPVDEMGRPLYGDVFGLSNIFRNRPMGAPILQNIESTDTSTPLWGELMSESESESEEELEPPLPEDIHTDGISTPAAPLPTGIATPSDLAIGGGLQTPDVIELRKRKIEEAMEMSETPTTLYRTIPEKTTSVGQDLMGSSRAYDLSRIKRDESVVPDEIDEDFRDITKGYGNVSETSQLDKSQKKKHSGSKKYKEFKF